MKQRPRKPYISDNIPRRLVKIRKKVANYPYDNGMSRKMVTNSDFPKIFLKLCFGESVNRLKLTENIRNQTMYKFVQTYESDGEVIDQMIFTKMWQKKGGLFDIIFDAIVCDGEVSVSQLIRFLPSVFGPRYS